MGGTHFLAETLDTVSTGDYCIYMTTSNGRVSDMGYPIYTVHTVSGEQVTGELSVNNERGAQVGDRFIPRDQIVQFLNVRSREWAEPV